MTHLLTSGANVFRRICAKGRYFEHLGLIQMFVYVFAIRKQEAQLSLTNRVMLVRKVVEVWPGFLSEYVDKKFTYICYRWYIWIYYGSKNCVIYNSYKIVKFTTVKKSKFSRTATHIFVSPGDAPATITQYVAWMERQFNACKRLAACTYLSSIVSELYDA